MVVSLEVARICCFPANLSDRFDGFSYALFFFIGCRDVKFLLFVVLLISLWHKQCQAVFWLTCACHVLHLIYSVINYPTWGKKNLRFNLNHSSHDKDWKCNVLKLAIPNYNRVTLLPNLCRFCFSQHGLTIDSRFFSIYFQEKYLQVLPDGLFKCVFLWLHFLIKRSQSSDY